MNLGIGKDFSKLLCGLKGLDGKNAIPQKPEVNSKKADMSLPNMLCGCQNCNQNLPFDFKNLIG